jgi:hypothetical protein
MADGDRASAEVDRAERFTQPGDAVSWSDAGPEGSPEALAVLQEHGVAAWEAFLVAGQTRSALPELPPDPDDFEPGFVGPEEDTERAWLPGEAEAWVADDHAGTLPNPFVVRAGDRDGSNLRRYWTKGPGLAKWRTSPTPWRTLKKFLSKYLSGETLEATTSAWYMAVFGRPAGRRRGRGRR